MREAVGGDVAQRVVDGDLPGIQLAHYRAQDGCDPCVVGVERVVQSRLGDKPPVRSADDGDMFVVACDDERALPGDVVPDDQVHYGIGRLGGLAHEGEPAVDPQL